MKILSPLLLGLLLIAPRLQASEAAMPDTFFDIWEPEILAPLIPHVDINRQNSTDKNRTLLMNCCFKIVEGNTDVSSGALSCMHLLLKQPTLHVNAQDTKGYTALHELMPKYSARRLPLVKELLERRADPYIANSKGETIPNMLVAARAMKGKSLIDPIIAACVESHAKAMLQELQKYLFKGPATITVDYLWEDYEREAVEASKKQEKQ